MPAQSAAAEDTSGGRRGGLVLLLLCAAQFMIVLDFSITNVALPTIQADLGFSVADLQWVVSAYALTFGGCLLLGGRIADLYGQRKAFITGLLVFGVASLLAGFAQDAIQLVVLRGVQGLAAALVAPAALALLTTSFPEGPARNRALGVWGAVLSLGFVCGVIAGGVLTDLLNWRWVFFINVPIGVITGIAAVALIAKSAPRWFEGSSVDGFSTIPRFQGSRVGHVRCLRDGVVEPPHEARPVAGGRGIDRGPRRERAPDRVQFLEPLAASARTTAGAVDARAIDRIDLVVKVQLDVGDRTARTASCAPSRRHAGAGRARRGADGRPRAAAVSPFPPQDRAHWQSPTISNLHGDAS